ncbi:hypothetical protein V6N13_054971 [Hibiscus sabdariffa]|uniref:Uncharacterized protein n=1 Tax=Hibiscus sabdariffa TaxID=183260 RepID=A0ABR2DZK8_9ROSI
MLNSVVSPSKRSKLESYMNREILRLSIFLLVVAVDAAVSSGWKLKSEISVDSELMDLLHKDLAGEERIDAHLFFLTLVCAQENVSCYKISGQHNQGVGILARETEKDDQIRQVTQIHLTDYLLEGLRTLVVAVRDLRDAELEQWQCQYEDARTCLIDRAAKLRQTAALVECNLNLL